MRTHVFTSVQLILEKLQEDDVGLGWPWSTSLLLKFVKLLGFTWGEGPNHDDVVRRNVKIINQKTTYIKRLQHLRLNAFVPYPPLLPVFLKEYVMQPKNCLQDLEEFPDGPPNSNPNKSKGSRIICIAMIDRDGWIPESIDIYTGAKRNKKIKDYHCELNMAKMLWWLENKCIPNMRDFSILRLDRAPYHVAISEATKPCKSSANKTELCDYLIKHGDITPRTDLMKKLAVDLVEMTKNIAPNPVYALNSIFENAKHPDGTKKHVQYIFSPVAESDLSGIEMGFSDFKPYVTKNNIVKKPKQVIDLAKKYFTLAEANAKIKNYWDHCIREEYAFMDELNDDVPMGEDEEGPLEEEEDFDGDDEE